MTTKRKLKKRLEAEREAKRMPFAAELGWEIDDELTERSSRSPAAGSNSLLTGIEGRLDRASNHFSGA